MKKKVRSAPNRGEPVSDSMRVAVANAAAPLEEMMSGADHGFGVELDPVLALDGELLIRREPVPDRIRLVVTPAVLEVHPIHPAPRWPQYFRSAVRRMDPPGGPKAHEAALDAQIHTLAGDVEKLLGTILFAAQVQIRPEDYYANIWDDFVLISYTHIARLSLTVTD